MFDVTVITAEFKDLSMVKQHRLVNDVRSQVFIMKVFIF